MMIYKVPFVSLFFAMLPMISARLTLLRLAQGGSNYYRANDQYSNNNNYRHTLRGLSAQDESPQEALMAARELIAFWPTYSMSTSMSIPTTFTPRLGGFDFFSSMSMSFSHNTPLATAGLPEDLSAWWDMSYSFSMSPTVPELLDTPEILIPMPDDAPSTIVSTTTTTAVGGTSSTDEENADSPVSNIGKGAASSASTGTTAPQMVLLIVLVGAAMAVLSAWYVRKNQRAMASSDASQMTPASAPLL